MWPMVHWLEWKNGWWDLKGEALVAEECFSAGTFDESAGRCID